MISKKQLLLSTSINGEICGWDTTDCIHKLSFKLFKPQASYVYLKHVSNSDGIYILDKKNSRIDFFSIEKQIEIGSFENFAGHPKYDSFEVTGDQSRIFGIDSEDLIKVRMAYTKSKRKDYFSKVYHTEYLNSIKLLETKKMLITCSNDKSLCFMNTNNLRLLFKVNDLHTSPVNHVKYLSNNILATGTRKGEFGIFDLKFKSLKPIKEFSTKNTKYLYTSYKDDLFIVAGSQDNVWIRKQSALYLLGDHSRSFAFNEAETSRISRQTPSHQNDKSRSFTSKELGNPDFKNNRYKQKYDASSIKHQIRETERELERKNHELSNLLNKKYQLTKENKDLDLSISEMISQNEISAENIKNGFLYKRRSLEEENANLKKKLEVQMEQIRELKMEIEEMTEANHENEVKENDVKAEYKKFKKKLKSKRIVFEGVEAELEETLKKYKKRKKKYKKYLAKLEEME